MTSRRLMLVALVLIVAACSESALSVGADESLMDVISSAPAGSVVRIPAGVHVGPIVIDQPIQLLGEPGAVIEAPPGSPVILIESDDVTIRDVTLLGGRSGIRVVDAENVVLDGVEVRGAQWHGILADDSHVVVTDCRISGLLAELSQGFEIRNSDGRTASRVEGCHIEGPVFEGLVAHVSHVTFVDNVVTGSLERGLVITEMSDGRMQGNTVEDAYGAAYFCGDMSRCSVVDNAVDGMREAEVGHASGGGHGLVVHYHSLAFVDGLTVNDVTGEPVMLMFDSELAAESLFP